MKWHYPVGLLYDLYSGAVPANPPSKGSRDAESPPPTSLRWRLLLHVSEFPDDQLVRLDDGGRVLHDSFVNSVKEADFLRNGTAKAIMTMSRQDSTQLWEAVEKRE